MSAIRVKTELAMGALCLLAALLFGCSNSGIEPNQDGFADTAEADVALNNELPDGGSDLPDEGLVDSSNPEDECRITSLKTFANRCAVKHDFEPTWEIGALSLVPSELGLVAAWTYENQCPIDFNLAFGPMVVQGNTLSTLDGGGSLATLDRTTGKQLACLQMTDKFSYGILTAIPNIAQVFLFAIQTPWNLYSEEAIEWTFVDPTNPAAPMTGSLFGCGAPSQDLRLTPDGQFIAHTLRPDGFVSIDPLTGDANWAVDFDELRALAPAGPFTGLVMRNMGFDKNTREVIMNVAPGVTVGVDPCGQISRRGDAIAATIIDFGLNHLELTHRRLKVVATDGEVLSDEACEQMVSLAEDVVVCINHGPVSTIDLSIHEVGQSKRKLLISPPSATTWDQMVATRDGVLLIPSVRGIEFYDWRAEIFIGTYEFTGGVDYSLNIRDVGVDGRVIVTLQDTIFAIDSNLTGLAPGRFPRGFDLGFQGNLVPW